MSLLSRLFGSRGTDESRPASVTPETHGDYMIYPEPMKDGPRWRICARIEKEVGGEMKSHRMIRADTLEGKEAAAAASADKARMLIDQQGERIFD